jgi:hypothetical protein
MKGGETMPPAHATRRNIASRVNQVLSEFGLENSVSGGKFDDLRQSISETTGYWSDGTFIAKPSRLIVHLEANAGAVTAVLPELNDNGNFAYANTARRSVGGLFVRVIPVVKVGEHKYKPYPEWEWILWYCFWPNVKHGSSGQLFDGFNPRQGTFTYMHEVQKYIAAGLVTLNRSEEQFTFPDSGLTITYGQATDALKNLIQVDVSIPVPFSPGVVGFSEVQVTDKLGELADAEKVTLQRNL